GKARWYWTSEIWRIASTTKRCCEAVAVMGKSVLAKVHWVPRKDGGRTSLPTGKTYSTVSRFQEDTGAWLQEAWSIVLAFEEPTGIPSTTSAAAGEPCPYTGWYAARPRLRRARGIAA